MPESEFTTVAVIAIVLVVGLVPVATGFPATAENSAASGPASSVAQDGTATDVQDGDTIEVEIQGFSAESVTLRNVTATDVVVQELTVRQLGSRENVTLRNVSAERLTVRRAELSDVRLRDATVRSEGLVTDFGVHYARGANVTNESRQSLLVRNRTLDGVIIEDLTVESARELNLSVPANATRNASVEPEEAELVVGNASVGSVTSLRGFVGNRTDAP